MARFEKAQCAITASAPLIEQQKQDRLIIDPSKTVSGKNHLNNVH